MKFISAVPVLLVAIVLAACAGGGSGSDPADETSADAAARAALPDHSASVERVQGEDPRRYFIANLRALNAVDKDGNGLWDDVERRLGELLEESPAPIEDKRALLMFVRDAQSRLQHRTSAEAREASRQSEKTWACTKGLIAAGNLPKNIGNEGTLSYFSRLSTLAVITSRERVLADRYADGLASGSSFRLPKADIKACEE